METEFISFIFYLFVFIGAVFALQDRQRLKQLVKKVHQLQNTIEQQSRRISTLEGREFSDQACSEQTHSENKLSECGQRNDETADSTSLTARTALGGSTATANPTQPQQPESESTVTITRAKPSKSKPAFKFDFTLDSLLKGNGLFWIGAAVLALGGVFLAKYSIEAGLLPPSVRVILGALFGVCLVTAAEVVNRYKEKLKINTPYISAALASGGVITCFAMTLVAFDFYHFIPANMAFVLLAIISLAATSLALRFGPVLAGIGIVGAYVVPALVSTGSNNIGALLLYISFVSLSAIWVADYVKQKWLRWQSFVGHFLWFCTAVAVGGSSDFWVLLIFALISMYLYVLVDVLGWRLTNSMVSPLPVKDLLMPRKEQLGILLPLLLIACALIIKTHIDTLIWANVLFASVVLCAAYRHSALDSWPFYLLLFVLLSFYLMPKVGTYDDVLFPFTGKYLFIQVAVVITMLFSMMMIKRYPSRLAYLMLLNVAPLALYGVSYAVSPKVSEAILYPVWAIEMLAIGLFASYCAMKTDTNIQQVTYLILANAMLSLCFTMLLSASSLTLAIAAQVASMSYLSWKYKVRLPDWLYKAALIAVVTRLTFAPWLADYKHETILTIHWTLVVYPLVLGIIWFATKYNPSKALNTWFMGVAMHIVALLVTTETSYLLIGDYPDFTNLGFQESVLLALNWLVLGAVYLWRGRLSEKANRLYPLAASLLVLASLLIHADISFANNPFFDRQYIGDSVFNWLLLQWLAPACVLAIMLQFKLIPPQFKRLVYGLIAVLGVLFINGEIRALFHEGFLVLSMPMEQSELYTYSIVWLLISTVLIFVAKRIEHKVLINAGFAGLAIVILKAFVVDMANLEGLLRALSFIGLGLCLVGIGWLFQKMQDQPREAKPTAD
ncbi:hypothetical protein CBQ28_15665 [Pseudoalteromonas sp. GCY]|uniref:DUF2339 domain-containing protein n=1 Tax=Pseudoalteromonas sp. GCY TaxID=2003316 RepID=UPI000BFEAC5A|nr:DUF2339 domain-containing protein [Pseudoalteromonas sp. GCY]PHI36102.1 hypothetical protein CBQ28_15665 [Pseudoalteromonas sp. GCY]QQQ68042.1 DUF2339 domain-containing protein [Pseudoalteromonas sp. GCY]